MTDKTINHRKDITIWLEQDGVSMDVTFDCTISITHTTAAPGQPARIVEIHSAEPIHVSYSDRDDNEITWHYGDNMPLAIVKALDRFDGIITRQIREEAEEIQ